MWVCTVDGVVYINTVPFIPSTGKQMRKTSGVLGGGPPIRIRIQEHKSERYYSLRLVQAFIEKTILTTTNLSSVEEGCWSIRNYAT